MEDLKEQIPKLIDSYSDLENSLGLDLNLENLKAAYEVLKTTGDATDVTTELERIDKTVAEAQLQ